MQQRRSTLKHPLGRYMNHRIIRAIYTYTRLRIPRQITKKRTTYPTDKGLSVHRLDEFQCFITKQSYHLRALEAEHRLRMAVLRNKSETVS